jgi:hypothetical protein
VLHEAVAVLSVLPLVGVLAFVACDIRRSLRIQPNNCVLPEEYKAWALLQSSLTPAQRRSMAKHDYFTFQGSDGDTYAIRASSMTAFNIYNVSNGLQLCGGPKDLPWPDIVLAQKLALQTDARWFRTIANCSRVLPIETALKRFPGVPAPTRSATVADRCGRLFHMP